MPDDTATVESVQERLKHVKKDDKVKAVLLLIDSPGGGITASDVMYNDILKYRKDLGKKVVFGGPHVTFLPDEALAGLDIVVASVHSGFKQSREQITGRVLSAIRHPCVSVIAHPTGRLIGERFRLEINSVPGLKPVRADRGQVEQALMNLVVNGADAMPAGGRITVSAAPAEMKETLKTANGQEVVVKAFTDPKHHKFGYRAGNVNQALIGIKVSLVENPDVNQELQLPPVWAILEHDPDFSFQVLDELIENLEDIVPLVRACSPQE